MIAKASLKYIRITPRKFRQVIPLVKGRRAEEAIAILMSVKKGASKYAIDLLKSALANAKRIQGVDASTLYISKFIADGGPMLKRFRAASMGRASPILKRTSHITVELDAAKKPEDEAGKVKVKERVAKEGPPPTNQRAPQAKAITSKVVKTGAVPPKKRKSKRGTYA